MRTGDKFKFAVVVLILSLGCNKKDPKEISLDAVPSLQNNSVQNLGLASAQKTDTQIARPSLAVSGDSLGSKTLSGAPIAGVKKNQDTVKEKRIEDHPKKDFSDNLPDLRPESKREEPALMNEKEKSEISSKAPQTEEAPASPGEIAYKSKEVTDKRIRSGVQHQNDKQLTLNRPSMQRPGSGEHQDIKVQAKDLSEQYEGLKARSKRYYQVALGFLGNHDDSALIYANKAIRTFENGSLFRVKAEALYNLKYFTNAEIACDVCLSRTDYWDFADVDRALKLKCGCNKKNYERFPSQESKEQYENACKAAGIVAGGK